VVLLIDIFLVANAFFISYLIRFNFSFTFGKHDLASQIALVIVVALISFLITGSYKGIVRHTGFKDAVSVAKSGFIISILLLLIVYFVRKTGHFSQFNIPISVIGFNFFVAVFMLISSRIIYKSFYQKIVSHIKKPTKILIHGAHSGKAVFDAILADIKPKYEVMGLVDERSEFLHKLIHRKEVYHPEQITKKFIEKTEIEEVIISKPEADSLELLEIANRYLDLGLKVKTVPYIKQWIENDRININQIKELNIEELLNRTPIKIDNPVLKQAIQQRIVMITGAAGSIGSEIASQIIQLNPKQLILIDQAESALYDLQQDFIRKGYTQNRFIPIVTDIRNARKIAEYINKYRPDIIYHAAAYKHVPLMEANPYEAVKVNVLGSKIVMDAAVKYKVSKFIMISTDKAVNPTSVMGATKRAAEMYATCLQKENPDTKFIITRFGNVLGSNGSVIPLFKKQLQQGGPLTVTHKEITRYFMTIPEACNLVLEAGTMGNGGEIFVFDMGEPVRIFDLAVKMIQLSGYKYPDDIDIIITGLRPGEKLYEETLGKNEGDLPTHNKKVLIAQINDVNCNDVEKNISGLQRIDELSTTEIVRILKMMIPEYKSQNSEYKILDNLSNN
jgi:FlaA1/EpsC-like NDP-sugar epimerase